MISADELKAFYSWQSDLPETENRNFIKGVLEESIKKLDKDKKRAFEYFGLNEDKSNSQSVSNNVLSLGATAISNMIKQL